MSKPVKVHSRGAVFSHYSINDYLMDDGTIETLTSEEARQRNCIHSWQHESIIQPGGRGFSTSWCRKCKISAHEYEKAVALSSQDGGTEA